MLAGWTGLILAPFVNLSVLRNLGLDGPPRWDPFSMKHIRKRNYGETLFLAKMDTLKV